VATREKISEKAYLPLLAAVKAGNVEEADKLNVASVPALTVYSENVASWRSINLHHRLTVNAE
jgi:hypothetical protein